MVEVAMMNNEEDSAANQFNRIDIDVVGEVEPEISMENNFTVEPKVTNFFPSFEIKWAPFHFITLVLLFFITVLSSYAHFGAVFDDSNTGTKLDTKVGGNNRQNDSKSARGLFDLFTFFDYITFSPQLMEDVFISKLIVGIILLTVVWIIFMNIYIASYSPETALQGESTSLISPAKKRSNKNNRGGSNLSNGGMNKSSSNLSSLGGQGGIEDGLSPMMMKADDNNTIIMSAFSASSSAFLILIILNRIILLLPCVTIGKYLGFYIDQLSFTTSYTFILFVTMMSAFLYSWIVLHSTETYNRTRQIRSKDILQTQAKYSNYYSMFIITSLFIGAAPGTLSALIDGKKNCAIVFALINILVSTVLNVYLIANKPFINELANNYIMFLNMIRIPLSFGWFIDTKYIDIATFSKISIILLILFLTIAIFSLFRFSYNRFCVNFFDDNANELTYSREQLANVQRPKFPWNVFSFKKQDIFCYFLLALATSSMTTINAFAARRMPIGVKALPDVFHERFNIAGSLRNSNSYGAFQISNLAVLALMIVAAISLFGASSYFNARRCVFIYCLLCFTRSVSFLITTLPAPCEGHVKCPCADPKMLRGLKQTNPLELSFSYLFGVGMFLKYPQCGDLIISGHTMFIWLAFRTVTDVIYHTVRVPYSGLISCVLGGLVLMAMGYIALTRNHYSIDVWFGYLFPEIYWSLYLALQKNVADRRIRRLDEGIATRFIRWLEYREIPLMTSYFENEVIVEQL